MRVEKIQAHEEKFAASGIDSDGKAFSLIKKSIEIFGEDRHMNYVEATPIDGDESYWYRTKYDKDQIVLHFTMGYLGGDTATLTKKDYHVSVPFLIGRNGIIYNLYHSFYWSYHLGSAAVGGNKIRSRKTIAVEISNIGPLIKDGNDLVTTYSKPEKKDVYCTLDQNEFYQEISFRGYDYYASFTEQQYQSLIILLRYLTARYKIPREILPEADRFQTNAAVPDFKGIVSHVNYRAKGKTDFGPAFDWQQLITGISPPAS